jgi:pyruvate, orthophosphate dikinase
MPSSWTVRSSSSRFCSPSCSSRSCSSGQRARPVYDFAEGDKDQKDLLGGKGANLAEMTNLGLPVPPGFIITTEACRPTCTAGRSRWSWPCRSPSAGQPRGQDRASGWVTRRPAAGLRALRGQVLDARHDGDGPQHRLNDAVRAGPAEASGDERFAWDSYRRLIQMFGKTVLGIDGDFFEHALEQAKTAQGRQDGRRPRRRRAPGAGRHLQGSSSRSHAGSTSRRTRASSSTSRSGRLRLVEHRARAALPPPGADPRTTWAPRSTCRRWSSATSATDSGTGVAFTRDPATGAPVSTATTCPTRRARTSSPASATPCRWPTSRSSTPPPTTSSWPSWKLEAHYRDLCDIEFTVERGKLWMLQTRVGKRTAGAAFRIAVQLVDEGLIDMDEALRAGQRRPARQLMFPHFDDSGRHKVVAKGMAPRRVRPSARRSCSTPPPPWSGRERRAGHPRPPGDQPRRPRGHGRRRRHPHQPRRQDLARGRRRARHGQDLPSAAPRSSTVDTHGKFATADGVCVIREGDVIHRRHHRRGLPRRGAGHPQPGRALLRGPGEPAEDDDGRSRPWTGCHGPTPTTSAA